MIGFEVVAGNLIAYFVERQRLVMLAMLDIEPEILATGGDIIAGIYLSPYVRKLEEKLKRGETFKQEGLWRGEWKYFQHGLGCLLKNIHTGEPLEWDAPDLHIFNPEWFWNHLQWRSKHHPDDPYVDLFLKSSYTTFDLFKTFIVKQNVIVLDDEGYFIARI